MEILIIIAAPLIAIAIGAIAGWAVRIRAEDNFIWEELYKRVQNQKPKEIITFDTKRAGVVTATVGYKQLEEMGFTLNEAERLIKEAKDWKVE